MADFVVQKLNHFAWRCRDAEETRHFYEDILGLPLVHVIRQDRVPSTQDYCPHAHIFFRMTDGSCIAFFDLGVNQTAEPSPNTPDESAVLIKQEGAKWAKMRVHSVTNEIMKELSASSKMIAEWDFLCLLRDKGRASAQSFLVQHVDNLGRRSTLDLDVLLQSV